MPRSELQIYVVSLIHILPPRLDRLLLARTFVVLVWQVQMSLRACGREHYHANHTSRASVPLDGLRKRTLDELDALLFCHVLLPVCITISVDVCGPRTADRVRLLVQRTS